MNESETAHKLDRPAGRQSSRKRWLWIAVVGVLIVGGWCVGIALLGGMVFSRGMTPAWGAGDAVAVIYIEGTIGSLTPSASGVDSQAVIQYVRQAEANPRVKAIVVSINSPGGAVVPSDEMYRALLEAEKPVVAVMGDIAASGGYYIACGADRMLAHPATLTGSIGVYGRLINAADLLKKLGVEGIIVRSGDSKASGNWFEHPTPEQLAIEQAIVDELHQMFVDIVVASRALSEERVRELADGRPYTGQQAFELGLIDELGGMQEGIDLAAELGGIQGEPLVIEYKSSPSLLGLWLGAKDTRQSELQALDLLEGQIFLPEMRYVAP
jgi:protease-4